jgi:hypothetical protein
LPGPPLCVCSAARAAAARPSSTHALGLLRAALARRAERQEQRGASPAPARAWPPPVMRPAPPAAP